MTPDELLARLAPVPYLINGADFNGLDCWGLVEVWYRDVLGIEITDRKAHRSAPDGLSAGFDARLDWIPTHEQNHAVWTARAFAGGGLIIKHGHCGILWQGRAYHMHRNGGFQHAHPGDRKLRINGFWIHKCLKSL